MVEKPIMNLPLAEHIARFTGRKTKFRERKFHKFLRQQRLKAAKRKPDNNKQLAID